MTTCPPIDHQAIARAQAEEWEALARWYDRADWPGHAHSAAVCRRTAEEYRAMATSAAPPAPEPPPPELRLVD